MSWRNWTEITNYKNVFWDSKCVAEVYKCYALFIKIELYYAEMTKSKKIW
jgi:hypothetical protein